MKRIFPVFFYIQHREDVWQGSAILPHFILPFQACAAGNFFSKQNRLFSFYQDKTTKIAYKRMRTPDLRLVRHDLHAYPEGGIMLLFNLTTHADTD
ncbi:hypothetical protein LJB82_00945, partial [Desulfovibrio sp. OttesenSCG-928-M16]|nr:hypothetical protein [Desulfovibrio sp. OttesenSCG-928-M16]